MNIRISPSQIAFDLKCPRCTWLRYNHSLALPGYPSPEFNLMDSAQKMALPLGTDLNPIGIPGKVWHHSVWSESRNLWENDDHMLQSVGKTDIMVELDEGGFAIVDLKSGRATKEKIDKYGPQIGCYALGLVEPYENEPLDIRAGYLAFCTPTIGTFISEPPVLMTQWAIDVKESKIDLDLVRKIALATGNIVLNPNCPDSAQDCKACTFAIRLIQVARSMGKAKSLAEG